MSFNNLENESIYSADREDFASLLEKSDDLNHQLEPGQKVTAKIIAISEDTVYIGLGGKNDGAIDISEFQDENGAIHVNTGDDIDAFFMFVKDGIKKLTTLVNGYPALKLNTLRNAFDNSLTVNGEVKTEVRGGFEISVDGVRCFCPVSHIDIRGSREVGSYIGKTFPFRILEYKNAERGVNIIVSRRVLLEQEKEDKINRLKQNLSVGMDTTAVVRSIQKFGVFVDLGGIDGMVPASEISWGRVENIADILSIGQKIDAKIISIDWENNKITLSMKALQPDPWRSVHEKYLVGSRISGAVVRLAPYGAFINIEPGIDGLIHISNLGAGRRINHPKEVVQVGQWVEAYVIASDPQLRKISLSMQPKLEPKAVNFPAVGEIIDGNVERVMPFGIFVKINDGLTGLVPNSEAATSRGTDHGKIFPPGSTMKALVLEVDADKKKVLLSRKGFLERAEQEEYEQYRDSVKNEQKSKSGLGTLGELIKAKMEEKKLVI